MTKQETYCQYLRDWADSHSGIGYEGMTPASFDEWEDGEGTESDEAFTATHIMQINYCGQDSEVRDTVVLTLPEYVFEAELYEAIQLLLPIYGDERYENEDMLDLSDEMLDELVSRWSGSWNYLNMFGVMEVNGYERTFHRG